MSMFLSALASLALASTGVDDEVMRLLAQQQPQAAFELAEQAAEDGSPHELTLLAEFYDQGIYVPANPTKAAQLLKRAADQGDAEAQWRLGTMVDSGRGVRAS